ncbi:MAG: hypothetical protein AAB016_11435, partial [candidate division NC10 bacterium]
PLRSLFGRTSVSSCEPPNEVFPPFLQKEHRRREEEEELPLREHDAAGEVVGKTVVYVNGQIPPFGRAYFTARVLAGATYRLTLLSVDWRSRPSSFQLILPRMGPAEGR